MLHCLHIPVASGAPPTVCCGHGWVCLMPSSRAVVFDRGRKELTTGGHDPSFAIGFQVSAHVLCCSVFLRRLFAPAWSLIDSLMVLMIMVLQRMTCYRRRTTMPPCRNPVRYDALCTHACSNNRSGVSFYFASVVV